MSCNRLFSWYLTPPFNFLLFFFFFKSRSWGKLIYFKTVFQALRKTTLEFTVNELSFKAGQFRPWAHWHCDNFVLSVIPLSTPEQHTQLQGSSNGEVERNRAFQICIWKLISGPLYPSRNTSYFPPLVFEMLRENSEMLLLILGSGKWVWKRKTKGQTAFTGRKPWN